MVIARLYLAFLVLLAAERGFELWLSRKNARTALASGAVERGRGHYPAMVMLHALFLIACAAEVVWLHRTPLGWLSALALAVAVAAQGLRYWAVATLKGRWTTRVIVWPDSPVITSGPYRWVRHPNYLAVALELLAVPLVGGAYVTAVVFSAANVWLLSVRIPLEERALGERWAEHFGKLHRFIPGGRT